MKFLRHVFWDVTIVFRDFIKWNLRKIIIVLPTFILGLPLFIYVAYAWLYIDFDSLTTYVFYSDIVGVLLFLLSLGTLNIFIIPLILLLLFGYSLSKTCLLHMNTAYIGGKKVVFKWKIKSLVLKSLSIFKHTLLLILILLIPILIYVLINIALVFIFWWPQEVITTLAAWQIWAYVVLTFLLTLLLIFTLIGVYYRIMFSYFIVFKSKKSDYKSLYKHIKKSIIATKWVKKFFKFVATFGVYILICVIPVSIISAYIEVKLTNYVNYERYLSVPKEVQAQARAQQPHYFEALELEFADREIQDIISSQSQFIYLSWLVGLLKFLILFWVPSLITYSFYNRYLSK